MDDPFNYAIIIATGIGLVVVGLVIRSHKSFHKKLQKIRDSVK